MRASGTGADALGPGGRERAQAEESGGVSGPSGEGLADASGRLSVSVQAGDAGSAGVGRARGWAIAEGGGWSRAECWTAWAGWVEGEELGRGCCWAKNRERPGWVIGLDCSWVWGLLDFLLFYSFPFQTNSN